MAGETGTGEGTGNGKAPEPEIIEIVEAVLDNQMFALAVVAGIVGGAIIAYLYFTREKGQGFTVPTMLRHIDDDDDASEAVENVAENEG